MVFNLCRLRENENKTVRLEQDKHIMNCHAEELEKSLKVYYMNTFLFIDCLICICLLIMKCIKKENNSFPEITVCYKHYYVRLY